MKSNIIRHRAILLMLGSFLSFIAIAQPPDLPEDPDIPLDGGLSILLAAGIGYGAKKSYDLRKKKDNNQSV